MRCLTTSLATAIVLCSLALIPTIASAAAPEIEVTTFSHLTTSSVRLEADINPEGRASLYHFEYGSGNCSANPCTSVPIPDGEIAGGTSPVRVKTEVQGLEPRTTYHFRVVAENGDGEKEGPDEILVTYQPPIEGLPDGRAYEQASPIVKNGLDVRGRVARVKASVNGNAVSFVTTNGIPGGEGGQELPTYLSSRGSSWSTQSLLPAASAGEKANAIGWLPDFSQVFDFATRLGPPTTTTFLARSSADGSLARITEGGQSLNPTYAGASADGSQVVFESPAKLLPTAIEGKSNVYLWDRASNKVFLVDVLNDGKALSEAGSFVGPYNWIAGISRASLSSGGAAIYYYTQDEHAISADGRRVYFTAGKSGQLYVRENPTEDQSPLGVNGKCEDPAKACTFHVSASRRTIGSGPEGTDAAGTSPAAFQAATLDGSVAFFTSPEKLTNDANTGPEPSHSPAIARATIDDMPASVNLDFLPAKALGVAVDGAHIYWTDPEAGTIGRAELDGANPEPSFITGAENPQDVAVDGTHIYWTNNDLAEEGSSKVMGEGMGTIGRADLEGENVNQDCISGANEPEGIAVDGAHIYWANAKGTVKGPFNAFNGTIGRADLNCSNSPEQRFVELADLVRSENPHGVAVDASHIFFSFSYENGEAPGEIGRAKIDGSEYQESIVGIEKNNSKPEIKPQIDVDGAHLYWTNPATNAIGRADLDGANANQNFISGVGQPKGIAVDASHIHWSANQEIVPNPGNDLYRYDADRTNGELTDLTPDPTEINGAEVKGLLGASTDGTYVYFAANGVLAPGATAGNCQGTASSFVHFTGFCNLYLSHEVSAGVRTTDFIARLDANGAEATSDATNWLPLGNTAQQSGRTARVSPDGRTLLFRSQEELGPYEHKDNAELYRYRVGEAVPTCVSCNPTNAAAVSSPTFGNISLSAILPPTPSLVLSRNLSADGNQIFFESTDALVASDTNGEDGCPEAGSSNFSFPGCQDVYEWEAEGSGSCDSDVQGGGCLYLLSTGKSTEASFFADASASGKDAFLITRSGLVGQDQDQLYDVYDTRVGGGLASQNQPPPNPCEGVDACHGTSTPPPASQSSGSASFVGPPSPKPKSTRHHRKKAHQHKKHSGQKHKARASR